MIFGLDTLAGVKYPKEVLKIVRFDLALGFFAETFGDAFKLVNQVLDKGCPHVRIQLLWSDSHKFGDADIPKIRKLSRQYQALALKYPAANVQISPFCEHNLSNPDKYLDICKQEAPLTEVVNTPWKGAFSKKYLNEPHGNTKGQQLYQYSFDGLDSANADIEAYKKNYSRATAFFFWVPQFNLKMRGDDPTPRPNRKVRPSVELLESAIYWGNKRDSVTLKKGFLWKSHAEQVKATNDNRANRPVCIIPIRGKRVELVNPNGKTVYTLPYFGPFSDGRHRYYAKDYGYQIAQQHGSPLQVCINGKCYGEIDPGFRANEYRNK